MLCARHEPASRGPGESGPAATLHVPGKHIHSCANKLDVSSLTGKGVSLQAKGIIAGKSEGVTVADGVIDVCPAYKRCNMTLSIAVNGRRFA
jgi:hypothetical protein